MDSPDDLVPLLIFAFVLYRIVRGALGGARTAGRTGATRTTGQGADRPSSAWEQVVAEIRKAAEEAQRAQVGGVEAVQPPPPPPAPTRLSTRLDAQFNPAERLGREDEFKPAERPATLPFEPSFEHEQHGFGEENPLSEESFERLPAGAEERGTLPAFDPHGLDGPAASPSARPAHPLVTRLRQPGAAREAFALQAVLGPPRGRG